MDENKMYTGRKVSVDVRVPTADEIDEGENLESIVNAMINHAYDNAEMEALRNTIVTQDRRHRRIDDSQEREILHLIEKVNEIQDVADLAIVVCSKLKKEKEELKGELYHAEAAYKQEVDTQKRVIDTMRRVIRETRERLMGL